MPMSALLNIAVAEPSAIIRSGLEAVLKRIPGFRIQIIEIATAELLQETLRSHKPDILIINPSLPGYYTIQLLKEETGCMDMKCIALLYAVADHALLRPYDDQINIYDSPDEIRHKLERLHTSPEEETENEEQQTLSAREIADRLFLSTHTVVTHRRNIARKLQVHSASGLTVYAIVNKLVELNDIKL